MNSCSVAIQWQLALMKSILLADFRLRNRVQEFDVTKSLSLLSAFAVGFAAIVAGYAAFAQKKTGPAEVPVEELMKPSDLPDVAEGPADAKVTVVEFASLTCGHCANFATKVYPEIKKKYVDTGKVRFVFREFPLDNLAAAAAMLSRCAAPDKSLALTETFFETQKDWAFTSGNPVPKLFDIAKQAGFTQESFDKCLRDDALLNKITAARSRASETFGVSATPTFFINGKRLQASPVLEEFSKVIDPLLATN